MSGANCQSIDVKAYNFGEGSPNERREAEAHVKSCGECREELARLEFVQAALGGLREEEPPRRIAFVSDKVFEPTWWQRFWAAGPRVGFAGAGLLSAAILVHGFTRPATTVQQTVPNAPVVAGVSPQAVQAQIDAAVAKAVAQIEERQKSKFNELLAATEKKSELERQGLVVLAEDNRWLKKQLTQSMIQNAGLVKQ